MALKLRNILNSIFQFFRGIVVQEVVKLNMMLEVDKILSDCKKG